MAGYAPVSGGFLNTMTGGRYGSPTTYGLQRAYQKRIDTIKKTLARKYADGDYSDTELDETLAKLKEIDSTELANMYLEYRKQNNDPEPTDFTPQDVQELKAIAGGDKGYNDMLQWATDTLNKQEIDMFDAVMEKKDPLSAFFAIRSLAYRYNDAKGYEGKMLTGTAPKTSNEVFRSQAEVVKAMSDPRYDNDPAYRADVMKKLEQSDINF